MNTLRIGMDLGSTTVKAAVLAEDGTLLFSAYERHHYHVRETAVRMAEEIGRRFSGCRFHIGLTGAEAMEAAEAWRVSFVQELTAECEAIRTYIGRADAAVELGGEDAKVTYFREGKEPDRRMNRSCAGGTGAFLDHLALSLGTDAAGLDRLAAAGREIYPIASRCGVFAKTDVQGLLNDGAAKEDIALSVFCAIAGQVVTGLARGCPIRGRVIFLGGPLTFLPKLRECFGDLLSLPAESMLVPAHSELYAALGAALLAEEDMRADVFLRRVREEKGHAPAGLVTEPLFASEAEYAAFRARHEKARVRRGHFGNDTRAVWLGIDAGSTTLKAVLIDETGAVLADWYAGHGGDVLDAGKTLIASVYEALPDGVTIAGAGVTGYGEDLLRAAFRLDAGEVETAAHLAAARFFCPDLTALLDIGGQDIKYIRLEDGVITQISLNGACASGCGAFLETFAGTLSMTAAEFAQKAVAANHALDLGYRCTVLMNSRVRQVEKDAADTGALAAGLCTAVVKNALYRVVKLSDASDMGERVVAEGGTFYNDAVLRSLEKILGHDVIRPDMAGLMGAYGMALLTQERFGAAHRSSMISQEEAAVLTAEERRARCGGCGNHCLVTSMRFSHGASFVTGYRCERGAHLFGRRGGAEPVTDLYTWKRDRIFRTCPLRGALRGTVGIPAMLGMWEDFPFWAAFFAELGFRVIRSEYNGKGISATAATMPEAVYCHACRLAHIHLWDLLEKKPDFIWLPVSERGREEPEIDERSHAHYGDTLADAMWEDIRRAGIPFLHPHLSAFGSRTLSLELGRIFDGRTAGEIDAAVRAGEAALRAYYTELREETEKVLAFAKRSGRDAVILCGRGYHADPQIHKGVPGILASLGIPVLDAEGILLLHEKGDTLRTGDRTLRERIMAALDVCEKEERLHLVQLHSVSCGYDGLTVMETERRLKAAGKIFTIVSLDQGMNAGAIRIRLRSLLAEIREFREHPEARARYAKKEEAAAQAVRHLYFPPVSTLYDPLIAEAFRAEGYEAELLETGSGAESLLEEAGVYAASAFRAMREKETVSSDGALLLLSSREDAAAVREGLRAAGKPCAVRYFDCGRRFGDIPVTLSLLRHFFAALFLGDMLLRIRLALDPKAGKAEDLLQSLQKPCLDAIREGTFEAYEAALRLMTEESKSASAGRRTEKEGLVIGIAGDPFLVNLSGAAAMAEKEGCRVLCMGLGEWYVDALSVIYWSASFGGKSEEAEICWAARNLGASYMNAFAEHLTAAPFLGGAERDTEKRQRVRPRIDEPESHLTEEEYDLLRRGAKGLLLMTELSAFGTHADAERRLAALRPSLPLLTAEWFEGQSLTNLRNRVRLLADEVKEKTAGYAVH